MRTRGRGTDAGGLREFTGTGVLAAKQEAQHARTAAIGHQRSHARQSGLV
jgi:hypothetical protein